MEFNDASSDGVSGPRVRWSANAVDHYIRTTRTTTAPDEAAVMEVYNGRNTVCMRDTDR